jgi:hypothetical protein
MAIARVQHDQAQTAGASPLAFTLPGAPTTGNFLLAMACGIQAGSPGFNAPPAGWVDLYRDPDKFIAHKVSDGTETSVSFSFVTGANDCRGYYVELSGAEAFHTFGQGSWTTQGNVVMAASKPAFPGCYAIVSWGSHSSITAAGTQNSKGFSLLPDSSTRNQAWEKLYPSTFPVQNADSIFSWGGDGASGKYVMAVIKPTGYSAPEVTSPMQDGPLRRI